MKIKRFQTLTIVFTLLFSMTSVVFAESITKQKADTHNQGVSDKGIVIGMSNALTGPAGSLGTNLKLGAQVYFDKVNNAGGIHGRQISMLSLDDGYEPVRTIRNTKELLDKDVFALFGYVGTPTSKVAVPIATRAKVPYLFPFTGAEFLRYPVTPNIFNIRASYFNETAFLVNHLVHDLDTKKVSIFIQDDGYGAAGRAGVQRALENYGLQIASVGKYRRNTVDINEAFDDVWKENPEAVIMIGAYKPCAEFVKKSKSAGKEAIFMNISFVGTSAFIKEAGPAGYGTYISQVVPHPMTSNLPLIKQYRTDLEAAGHEGSINFGTLEGYINALTFVKALNKNGRNLTRESFMETLEHLTFNDGGLAVSFSPQKHQGLQRVYMTKIVDGKAVEVEHIDDGGNHNGNLRH